MTQVATRADARRNRVRILEAAHQAITEVGIDVSMDDIAKLADVGKGTLYRHFTSREDLLTAILEARVERIEASAATALAEPDPEVGFREFVRWTAELQAGNESLYGVLRRLRETHAAAAVWDRRIHAAADKMLALGQSNGFVRKNISKGDVGVCIRMLAASARASSADDETPTVKDVHLDVVLRGLAP